MPEGPEAAHAAGELNKKLAGKQLVGIEILRGRYKNHGPPRDYDVFMTALPLRLVSVEKKGKVLFFHFDKGWYMVSHLGMSGLWYVDDDKPTWRADFRSVAFSFASGSSLTYSDPRSYGTLTFTRDIQPELDALAIDVMDARTTWPRFQEALGALRPAALKWPVERLLSDQQKLVSGIGNYLKSEIMYAARVAPTRAASSLTEAEWHAVFDATKRITAAFARALKARTADEYEAGFAVYGRREDPSGNPVVTYKNKEARTVHWVPAVQA